jgi:hypothetical protein
MHGNFPRVAIAQSSDCKSIPNPSERLAFYDKAAPPPAAAKPKLKPTNAAAPEQTGKFVDQLAIEHERLNAKPKTICRGC